MVCVGLFLSAMCPYNILKVYAHTCFYLGNLALHFERNYFWEEKTRLSTVSVVSIAKTDDLSKSTQLWAKTGCYGNAAACRPIKEDHLGSLLTGHLTLEHQFCFQSTSHSGQAVVMKI